MAAVAPPQRRTAAKSAPAPPPGLLVSTSDGLSEELVVLLRLLQAADVLSIELTEWLLRVLIGFASGAWFLFDSMRLTFQEQPILV